MLSHSMTMHDGTRKVVSSNRPEFEKASAFAITPVLTIELNSLLHDVTICYMFPRVSCVAHCSHILFFHSEVIMFKPKIIFQSFRKVTWTYCSRRFGTPMAVVLALAAAPFQSTTSTGELNWLLDDFLSKKTGKATLLINYICIIK